MPGTFSLGERKVRPGVYYRRENAGGVEVVGATNGYCACLFQSNWGPLNKEFDMDVTMRNNIADYYGDGEGTKIIAEAFAGGATTIRAVRVGNDDGVASSITLNDTAGNPAVMIEAKYVGDRPFTVSVRTNLVTGNKQCIIYDGTTIFEQYSFEAGENESAKLVEVMETSRNFQAVDVSTSAYDGLAIVTQQAMVTGKNPTVTTASYSKGTDVLERFKWNSVCADTSDNAVQSILIAFVQQSYETGHLGITCIADDHRMDLEDRMQKAAAINDEKVAYVPCGWVSYDGTEYEGWLAAARIAGMISSFETNTSLTHDVVTGAVSLIEPLTNGEIIRAEQKGCLVLSVNDEDQIWIDNAINTLITVNENMDEGWKKLRRTKCRFELMDRLDSTADKLVGKVNNDSDGRGTIMAAGQKVINEMIEEKKLMPGTYIYEDYAKPAEGDSCWFKIACDDIDSAEKIYLTYRFRFSPNS